MCVGGGGSGCAAAQAYADRGMSASPGEVLVLGWCAGVLDGCNRNMQQPPPVSVLLPYSKWLLGDHRSYVRMRRPAAFVSVTRKQKTLVPQTHTRAQRSRRHSRAPRVPLLSWAPPGTAGCGAACCPGLLMLSRPR